MSEERDLIPHLQREITRLRAQVREAVDGAQPLWSGEVAADKAEIQRLRGEVERLRGALLPFAVARLQAGIWPDQKGYGGKPWHEAVADHVSADQWAEAAITYSGHPRYALHLWQPEYPPSETQARALLANLEREG